MGSSLPRFYHHLNVMFNYFPQCVVSVIRGTQSEVLVAQSSIWVLVLTVSSDGKQQTDPLDLQLGSTLTLLTFSG